MTYETVLYEVETGVATITLNRPDKLNSVTQEMYDEMRAALAQADADDTVRVMVLTGAGRAFCAGADMGRLNDLSKEGSKLGPSVYAFDHLMRGDYQERYTFQPALTKPVIAAVNGAAAGVGMLLSLFCDIRIASESAMFTTGFSRRGLTAELGIAWRLVHLVGHGRATDLMLRAPRLSGKEAAEIGLVEFCVPDGEFQTFYRNYAQELANEVSPRSLRVIKRQLWELPFQTLGEHLRDARREAVESLKSEDFKEGLAHFREKRKPRFTGK